MYSPDSREADPLAGRLRDGGMTVTAASNPPVPSSSRMDALIGLEDVTKRYDGDAAPAVHGVGMQIAPGESVAVMGPSGSGKSTLLNMIAGLDRPTSGTVTVAGERIDRLSETGLARFRRRQVGMIFQFFNLLDDMTVLDNVLLPAQLAGMPPGPGPGPGGRTADRAADRAASQRLPGPAIRRAATAGSHRPRAGQPARAVAGRRADRRPGHRHGGGDRRAAG